MIKNKPIIVGIDEAGRGPVIGPLVMAALAVDADGEQKLKWLGVKDSKLLSSQVREELFDRIHEIVLDFRIEVIEPDAIDLSLQSATSNLNWLEADTAASMITELHPDKIIIDCPSVNIKSYTAYLLRKLPANLQKAQFLIEHKADVNHISVAAASVVAKVIRDKYIDHYKTEIGIDFGSGYMSDPKTQDFLEKYHDKYPDLFRKGWRSFKDVEDLKKQKKLGEF